MSHMRVLAVLTATIAVLACSPSVAQGQSVEAVDEATGLSCEIVPCETDTHIENFVIYAHLLTGVEIVTSVCAAEFTGVLLEPDEGLLQNQVVTGPNCPIKPCEATTPASGDGDPWVTYLEESTSGPSEFMLTVTSCFQAVNGGPDRLCTLEAGFSETEVSHQTEVAGDDVTCQEPPPAGTRAVEYDFHSVSEDASIEYTHGG